MWKYLSIALLCSASIGYAEELAPITIRDFSCGMITQQDPTIIGNGCAAFLQNVDVHTGSIETRRGSQRQNTLATDACSFSGQSRRFVHEFPDPNGNFWLISVSSNSLCSSNDAGVTNTILTSTHGITSASKFHAVNAFGTVLLTDGTTNWIVWDGAIVSVSTASPKGTGAIFWMERIWTHVGSVIHASRFGNAEDWTDEGVDDADYFSENIRLNNGYDIRKVIVFRNVLLVYKDFSIDLITTNDGGLTLTRTSLVDDLGTQHPDSVVIRKNDVIWLGHDNYYSFNGSQINPISEPIKQDVKKIKQLNSFERSQTITTQAGFDAGV